MMRLSVNDPTAAALKTAITQGDVAALDALLMATPGLATALLVDAGGVSRPALHLVADWPGHFPNGAAMVAVLVEAGADVNARLVHPDPQAAPETALHWAASSNDVAVLDALLDRGADLEADGAVLTGGTPMADAVVFAQWDAARHLLARGATTTLWQAAALGLLERVAMLCDEAPVPGPEALTNALWHACRGGQQPVAALLLERGADLQWVGYDHKTPLDAARDGDAPALVEWLLARGATSGGHG